MAGALKVPEFLRDKIDFGDKLLPGQPDRTRVCRRDDEEPQKIDELINESIRYRLDYWSKIGKQAMLAKCDFNPNMPDHWKRKFSDLIWDFRDCQGEDLKAISGGVRDLALHLGQNGAPIEPVKQRSCSKFSKEVFNMVIKAYIEANIVKLSTDSCISHGFVLKKPHIPPGLPRMKTLSDLQNPAIDDLSLGKIWRLIIDQRALNFGLQDFSTPNATIREIMNVFTTDKIFITADILNFFSQVTLSKASRWLTTFSAGYAEMTWALSRAPQGSNSSCPACSLILKLILFGLLREGFSFSYVDNLALSDYSFEG